MPGVIDQTSIGFTREVGKMAFLQDDISSLMNFEDVEEFADKLIQSGGLDLLSPPSSSSSSPSRDNADSEFELLPDYETPVDLLNFMDGPDTLLPGLLPGLSGSLCDVDYGSLEKRILKVSCSNKDPFMGHRDEDFKEFISSVDSPLGSDAILDQYRNTLLDDPAHQHHQPAQTGFSAWGHTPTTDDDEPVFPGSSSSCSTYSDDQDALPDTPMSYSGTVTGDDSDVDIETIPDTPHSVELCGYSSSDASSDLSPSISPSPLQNHSNNKLSILKRYSSHIALSSSSSSSPKPLIRYNSCGVSSSVSLAENLMSGRSIVGKKRKHHKDKYTVSKSHVNVQNSFNTYYPTGNSVNFHDYAMSPSSCMSTETAQPTVLSSSSSSSSKRIYKRRQLSTLDLSDKEKQNHHNQLERNRRQKLADLFIDLRDEVPSISNQSKASKVMILNQATTYIEDLQRLHRSQEDILTKELHRKEYLKKQLKQLEALVSRR